MGENTKIEWASDTFNPWWGCTKVSPGCDRCYADSLSKRYGHNIWGKKASRRQLSDANWRKPVKWNREAQESGETRRVFCASMCDVFEDRRDLDVHRARLFELIEATPALIWMLLTKRPEIVRRLVPESWLSGFPSHVWMGTSVEDQRRADERIPALGGIPASVRFISAEPLLGPVDFGLDAATCDCCKRRGSRWVRLKRTVASDLPLEAIAHRAEPGAYRATSNQHGALCIPTPGGPLGIKPSEFEVLPAPDWIICGAESGPGARPMNIAWPRSIAEQCHGAGKAFFMKQVGQRPFDTENHWGTRGGITVPVYNTDPWEWRDPLRHSKGGNPQEWDANLRIQQWPVMS